MPNASHAIAALLLSLSILRLSADGVDGTCQMPTCRAVDVEEEEAETLQELDIAMHMQTRVMRHDIPTPTSDVPVASKTHDIPIPAMDVPVASKTHDTPIPAGDVPVASKTQDTPVPAIDVPVEGSTNANSKPSPGQDDLLDKEQAITAAESILREGLREAVSDLRGEWQQRLDQLKEREQKAERQQEAFGPMLEFRGIGSAPPSLVVEAKRSQALGKDFLTAVSDPAASIYVIAAVLAIIFVLFLVRKLYVLEFRESKSQVAAFLEAETNASAKLQYLLETMGFESTADADALIVQQTRSNKSIEHGAASDSEEEPEAECSVETTVKAWLNKIENKIAAENVVEQAQTPVIVAETPSPVATADAQNLPEIDSPA